MSLHVCHDGYSGSHGGVVPGYRFCRRHLDERRANSSNGNHALRVCRTPGCDNGVAADADNTCAACQGGPTTAPHPRRARTLKDVAAERRDNVDLFGVFPYRLRPVGWVIRDSAEALRPVLQNAWRRLKGELSRFGPVFRGEDARVNAERRAGRQQGYEEASLVLRRAGHAEAADVIAKKPI